MYLFWQREVGGESGVGAEGGRERIPSRAHTVSTEPDAELNLANPEIVTWVEIKSQTFSWLSHPGTLRQKYF